MSAHPLAGLAPPAPFRSAPSPPPVGRSPPVVSSASSSPPLVQGTVSYSSDEDEAGDPRKRRVNPFANTIAQTTDGAHVSRARPKSEFPSRQAEFWRALHAADTQGVIDEGIVRRYLFDYGSPEQPAGLRGLLWKLLLGYLPWDRTRWSASLQGTRAVYDQHVRELTNNPFADMASTPTGSKASSGGAIVKQTLTFQKVSSFDDPLSTASSNSTWSGYYADNSIREEIEKDVRRTYSSFHFFNERVTPVVSTAEEIKKADADERERLRKENERTGGFGHSSGGGFGVGGKPVRNLFDSDNLYKATSAKDSTIPSIPKIECASSVQSRSTEEETHHDVIKRILFVYAKLNPAVRYVQGMNELLAPIYYVFAHNGADLRAIDRATGLPVDDSFSQQKVSDLFPTHSAEADAFFCFSSIMSHMRDRFIKSLDLAPTGVLSVIANLNGLLSKIDYPLWAHLNAISVDPRFYSFRWLTLMLSQEFELPDVMRLWDALFAAEKEAQMGTSPDGGQAKTIGPTPPTQANKLAGADGGLDFSEESTFKSPSSSSSGPKKTPIGTRGRGDPPPAVVPQSLSEPKLIVEFLNDVCCAMLVLSRGHLLEADFAIALKLLQSTGQGLDIQRLLVKAQEIRRMRHQFLAQAAATAHMQERPLPAPLSVKESSSSFTTPVPRPGGETTTTTSGSGGRKGSEGRPIHIALLNAERLPSLQVLPAAQQQQQQQQQHHQHPHHHHPHAAGASPRLHHPLPAMQASPGLSDDDSTVGAPSSVGVVPASVQQVLDGAAHLADHLQSLALSTAAAAKPLVQAGLESAKEVAHAGKEAVQAAVHRATGPAATPHPKDVPMNGTAEVEPPPAAPGTKNLFPDSP